MKTTDFTIVLGSDDHEVLDDAVKRVLVLDDGDQTKLTVIPIAAIKSDGEARRIQQRRIRITSTDDNILARTQRIDFQRGVIVTAQNGK